MKILNASKDCPSPLYMPFADKLVEDGHFTILCRHGVGHYFTQGVAVSGLQFLSAHSWKNTTSFWQQNGLPGAFDSSCSIH